MDESRRLAETLDNIRGALEDIAAGQAALAEQVAPVAAYISEQSRRQAEDDMIASLGLVRGDDGKPRLPVVPPEPHAPEWMNKRTAFGGLGIGGLVTVIVLVVRALFPGLDDGQGALGGDDDIATAAAGECHEGRPA